MNKSKYCTIYLVRHGRTDWNDKELIQGHTDTKLNLEGKDSAKKLAKSFKKPIGSGYSGSLPNKFVLNIIKITRNY